MAGEGLSQESRQRWLDLMAAKQAEEAAHEESQAQTVASMRSAMEGLSPTMPLTDMPVQADLTETLEPPEGITLPATGTENVLDAILGEKFYTKSQPRISGEEVARRQNLGLDVMTGEPIPEEPEVERVRPPPRTTPKSDTGGFDLSTYMPDVSGYDEAAAAYRRMGRAAGRAGDVEHDKLLQRFGPEQLTLAERQLQIREEREERMANYDIQFEDDYEDAVLSRKYPGASLEQVKDWQYELELNEDIKSGRRDISPEGAADVLRRAAVAKRNLAKAQEIDPGRAFGNVGSKILAALAVGAGSWAATRTGRNPALELYNKAIANDISAQKEMFAHKRAAPGRMQSEYKFFMDKYNNTEVAELATAASQWGAAAQELTATGLQLKGEVEKEKAFALAGEARAKGQVIKSKAAKAARIAQARQFSGINDMQGKPIRWVGGKHGLEKQDPEEKKLLLAEREKANMLTVAIDKYIESTHADRAWIPGSEARSAAEGLREALVHGEGKFFGMGVLQFFERQFLEGVIPTGESIPESIFTWLKGDSSRIAAYGEALKEFANERFMGAVGALGNYEPWGGEGVKARKKGQRGASQKALDFAARSGG